MSTPHSKFSENPLVAAFRTLAGFGRPGRWVWQNGNLIADPAERLDYLIHATRWLVQKTTGKEAGRYIEPPVDFRTFVESDELLKKRTILWPEVIAVGAEINSGRYQEVVLTGGIGVAKTTLAIYSLAYQWYVLSRLKDPHGLFDLDPSSEILMVFQSLNKNLAMDVDYRRFRSMIDKSPFFERVFPYDRSRLSEVRSPNNIIIKPVSGQDTGAIGQNVIGGLIDEVNFMALVEESKHMRDGSVYDQAAENYNSIARRRESRFMQKGVVPGLLCLVSSANYPGGLTDRKRAEARTNDAIYVYDRRLWEIRPERFGPERFRVFVGDETRHPRILSDKDVVALADEPKVVHVPMEYKAKFENDLLKCIRDIAGYSTQSLHPFMLNSDAVAKCFGKVQSIGSREAIDFKHTTLQIFPELVQHPNEPRFAHIDLSRTKDSAGLSIGHIPGFRQMSRGDYQEILPIIQFDLILEIMPPPGGEIEYERIRQLLYNLRDKVGVPVKWASFDQYQSTDSQQILAQNGFVVGHQSMDTDTHAYDMTKQAFYDERILAPKHEKALREMITLEFDAKHLTIDHPPQGSKDVSDSMAGVVWGLTMRRDLWHRFGVPLSRIPASLAKITGKNSITAKERDLTKRQPDQAYMDLVRATRGVAPADRGVDA